MTSLEFILTAQQHEALVRTLSMPHPFSAATPSPELARALSDADLLDETETSTQALSDALTSDNPLGAIMSLMGVQSDSSSETKPDIAVILPLTESLAKEFDAMLLTRCGIVFDLDADPADPALLQATKIVKKAIQKTFPTLTPLGLAPGQVEYAAVEPAMAANEAILCIASETDGDIAGYFVLDADAVESMNTSQNDTWGFLMEDGASLVTHHTSLKDALAEIAERNLILVDDFGCAAY